MKEQLFDLIAGNCHNDQAAWDAVEKISKAWEQENETLIKIAKFHAVICQTHGLPDRKKYREYLDRLESKSEQIDIKWNDFSLQKPQHGEWCAFIPGIEDLDTGDVEYVDDSTVLVGKYDKDEQAFIDPHYKNFLYGGIAKYATLKNIFSTDQFE